MGFKKNWDIDSIYGQIHAIAREAASPLNDGFTAWGCKQDLYLIKWLIEDSLRRCSTFAGEEEFLKKRQEELVIKFLSEDAK